MTKRRTESNDAWMEVNTSGSRTDCFYGFKDGTDIHGHGVLSGSEIIYNRSISGAVMILSGATVLVSGANFIMGCE